MVKTKRFGAAHSVRWSLLLPGANHQMKTVRGRFSRHSISRVLIRHLCVSALRGRRLMIFGESKFPVHNEKDFHLLASERLGLNVGSRFSESWKRQVKSWRDTEWPRRCWADRWGVFFIGPLRNLMGLKGLCPTLYDQPSLLARMMTQRADAVIAITAHHSRNARSIC